MTSHGQIAYDAYRLHSGGKNLISGQPISDWEELTPEIQAAWEASGAAVQSVASGAMHGIGYHDGWLACMEHYGYRDVTVSVNVIDSQLGSA